MLQKRLLPALLALCLLLPVLFLPAQAEKTSGVVRVLLTKPSELAFYPVPKLFLKRIGGHERWGAIHSAEMGDGTLECEDIPHTLQMLDLFLREEDLLESMCSAIIGNKAQGVYDGAYRAVKIAMGMKQQQ